MLTPLTIGAELGERSCDIASIEWATMPGRWHVVTTFPLWTFI
jgi:hypothetical protein